MQKQDQYLTLNQGILIITLMITGSSFIVGINSRANQDAWVSIAIGLILMIPLCLIYGRIMRLYPETNLTDIIILLFGNFLGKIVVLFMTFYAIIIGTVVLRNFSEFFSIVALPETPELPIMIALIGVCIYLEKSGVATLGKWAVVSFFTLVLMVFFTILFSLNILDKNYLYPFFSNPLPQIMIGSIEVLAFPLAETVLFLGYAKAINKRDSPYRLYIWSIAIGGFLLLMIAIRNILVLGPEIINIFYFPSYTAAAVIHFTDLIQRIEGVIAINFIVGGITKLVVSLHFACKGVARLFNANYKAIITPVSLIILALCANSYTNIQQMYDFIRIYPVFSLPFQVMIPILIWIVAEFKHHQKNKSTLNS